MSNESQAKNSVQQMAEKMMPGIKTDHGGINLGDVVVLIMSSVLLIYTGYRSWHFLSLSIPADFQILAMVGLWGIDIAMVFWAVTWIFGSSSPAQDGVSMTMWVIDVIAMILTSVIDTIMYADGSTIPEIVKTIAWYGVPLIIVGNATMAVIYHFTSPATKYRRQQRKLDARMEEARQKGDFEIKEITATADRLQEYTIRRANALLSIAAISDQSVELANLEQDILKRLNRAGMGHMSGPLVSKDDQFQAKTSDDDLKAKISQIKQSLKKDTDLEPVHVRGNNGSGPKTVGYDKFEAEAESEKLTYQREERD